ncbi:MAG: hypothetical protein ACKOBW_03600 [Planctomycetota bacterium]
MKAKLLLVGWLLVTLVGCGGEGGKALSPAQGTVKYNGQPVSGASVSFLFDNGAEVAAGSTDASGKFTLTTGGRSGAPIGDAKVVISKITGGTTAGVNTDQMTPDDMRKMQMAAQTDPANSAPKNELPAKFADVKTSPLVANVVKGGATENSFEFNLTD